ncbi:MAG: efflux RND transporter periplasmic adaptor subunit [Methylococcales bacterium]
MKINASIAMLIQLFCFAGHVHGENEIVFTREQIANLRLTTSPPEKAGPRPLFTAPAMVTVPPAQEIVVTDPNGGVIRQIFVSEGETVTKGQKLIEIISPGLLGSQRDLLMAQSHYQLAERQFNREKSLFDQGVIAEKRLQEADTHFQQARVSRDEARQMLAIGGFSKSELATLIRTGQLRISKSLHAPAAGVILHKFVAVGQRIEVRDPLFSIADLSRLWLEAAVSQPNVSLIRSDDVMEIPGIPVAGQIILIDSKVDEKHQSVLVRALIEHPEGPIRPGQSVQVTVRRPRQQDLWMVPKASLVRHQGKTLLFVRSENGFIPRFVEPMVETDGNVIIQGNVGLNDQIAVQGTIAIKAHWLGFGGGQ